jgi:aspartate-semialdehyde dehydrogenase
MLAEANDKPIVGLVGATGAAGSTLLRILDERDFPLAELRPFASERSANSIVSFRDHELSVSVVDDRPLESCDVVFFAAGAGTSRRFAPAVAASGGVAVDKSSAYRMDPAVPLVVPEVNPRAVVTHRGIVSNPNCVAIPLTVVLAPLHREAGLTHLTVATYQAASGAGRALIEELKHQEREEAAGREPTATSYPHVLHGNVVPGGWAIEGDEMEEERKVRAETRRVLDLPDLPVSVTTVRVPVAVGHSMAVWVELERSLAPERAREILACAPGIRVVDDPASQTYPTPRAAAGTDDVLVGRVRRDEARENALALFISADNLRKGAATNAVQVAELLLTR